MDGTIDIDKLQRDLRAAYVEISKTLKRNNEGFYEIKYAYNGDKPCQCGARFITNNNCFIYYCPICGNVLVHSRKGRGSNK